MSDAVLTAIIVAIPTTIVSVTGLLISLQNKKGIKDVHVAVNSGLSKQLSNATDAGELKGRKDEKAGV